MTLKKLAKLKNGWRWLRTGETTNPDTDYHCYPPGSGQALIRIATQFVLNKTLQGVVLRNESKTSKWPLEA